MNGEIAMDEPEEQIEFGQETRSRGWTRYAPAAAGALGAAAYLNPPGAAVLLIGFGVAVLVDHFFDQ